MDYSEIGFFSALCAFIVICIAHGPYFGPLCSLIQTAFYHHSGHSCVHCNSETLSCSLPVPIATLQRFHYILRTTFYMLYPTVVVFAFIFASILPCYIELIFFILLILDKGTVSVESSYRVLGPINSWSWKRCYSSHFYIIIYDQYGNLPNYIGRCTPKHPRDPVM